MDRLYIPSDDEMIFHYCSTPTFHAIATSKSLRFSDIHMLNDESEHRWAYTIFEEAATNLIKGIGIINNFPKIDISFINAIDEVISPLQLIAHPFITCFSLAPDVLSQWRAYADDGRGLAIGFDAVSMKKQLPTTFLKVLYNKEQQVKEVMAAIVAIYLEYGPTKKTETSGFFEDCFLLGMYMTALKHPNFSEEQEVRAVYAVNVEQQGNLIKFKNNGGVVNGSVDVAGSDICFYVRDNHLTAYIDIPLYPLGMASPIHKLILGPKNNSFPGNLHLFLSGLGYTNMVIHKSTTPYR